MSLNNKNRYLHDVEMKETNVVLKTYTGEIIPLVGEMFVIVEYGNQRKQLQLIITKNDGPSLFGRKWIQLDWNKYIFLKIVLRLQ